MGIYRQFSHGLMWLPIALVLCIETIVSKRQNRFLRAKVLHIYLLLIVSGHNLFSIVECIAGFVLSGSIFAAYNSSIFSCLRRIDAGTTIALNPPSFT